LKYVTRVERRISARKSRVQTISAEHISVIAAGLFALVSSFIFALGFARKEEESFACA
jgi:hypothetical protein